MAAPGFQPGRDPELQSDDAAVSAAVVRLVDAFSKRDAAAAVACWSKQAAQAAAFGPVAAQVPDGSTFAPPIVTRVRVDKDRAFARVRIVRTKGTETEPLVWNAEFVRETPGGPWLWWSQTSALFDLLRALVAAPDAPGRARLLAENADLVDIDLVEGLTGTAKELVGRRRGPDALRLCDFAAEAARAFPAETARTDAVADVEIARGETLAALSRHADALDAYRRAIDGYRAARDENGEAAALSHAGIALQDLNRFAESIAMHAACLTICRARGDRAGEATSLNSIGLCLRNLGRWTEALERYDESRALALAINDRHGIGRAQANRGVVLTTLGRNDDALAALEDARAIGTEFKDDRLTGAALSGIGWLQLTLGRLDDAQKTLTECAALAEKTGDAALRLKARTNLGSVASAQGRFAEARARFAAALKDARALGDASTEAAVQIGIGNIHFATGLYTDAQTAYRAARARFDRIGEAAGIATADNNLGNILLETGRYAEAIPLYERSLDAAKRIGDVAGAGRALNNLGLVYTFMGRPADARTRFDESLGLAEKAGDSVLQGRTQDNLGLVELASDHADAAIARHEAALALKKTSGDRVGEVQSLLNLSRALLAKNNLAEARTRVRAALEIARSLGDRVGQTSALSNLGLISNLIGENDVALREFDAALKIARPMGQSEAIFRAECGLGYVYADRKDWTRAVAAFRRSIAEIERVRERTRAQALQTTFLGQHTAAYAELSRCLIEQGDAAGAFAVSEQAKARGLVDIMRSSRVVITKSMTPAQRLQELDLEGRMARLNERIETTYSTNDQEVLIGERDKARAEIEAMRLRLYLQHPDLRAARAAFTPATLREIGRTLSANPARPLRLLSYAVRDDETLLFVLSPDARDGARLRVHRLPIGRDALNARVQSFWTQCSRADGKFETDGRALFQTLIAPALPDLIGATEIAIIPDGPLQTLPFAALVDGSGRPLATRFAIGYAPSATALVAMRQQAEQRRRRPGKPASPTLLAIGDPVFGSGHAPLAGSRREVALIAKTFPPGRATVLVGAAATETRARTAAARASTIHFATHGILNPDAPLYSGILLTRDARNDGLLQARELTDMNLSADLVVLSACETALGQRISGEGILGLTWSLFVAGASSTIATQWQVDDDATQSLMAAFYKNRATAPTATEALRQAQLGLIRSGRTHPYFWAPFVFSGDRAR